MGIVRSELALDPGIISWILFKYVILDSSEESNKCFMHAFHRLTGLMKKLFLEMSSLCIGQRSLKWFVFGHNFSFS